MEIDTEEQEADVVELAPSPVKASKTIEIIWDDDKIEKFIDNAGVKHWRCLWCNSTFKHWNATKALLHVHRIAGNNIHKCKSREIDASHKEVYARLYDKGTQRKNAQKQADETKKRSSDEYIAAAGEAYAATRRKRPSPLSSVGTRTPSEKGTPPNQIQTHLNFATDDQRVDISTPRYYQQKLTEAMDPQTEGELTMAIADLIHSCGLPFSLASHHKFRRVLSLARCATKKYNPPGRNKVAGELLDLNYQLYITKTFESLIKEADVYGVSFFGDAATVKKTPLINILASSVHMPVGCLQIVDCSAHLQSEGRKDASYISQLFLPHITEIENKVPRCTDLVIFDGASNVQKAGALLEAKFPHISVMHGAEHVISLLYHDIFKLPPFKILKNINRLIYRYFGSGSMHQPYAIFSKHSREHNGGKPIGLIRAADTRMGGHVISMLRTLRLRRPLISTVSSASFIHGKFPIDKRIIDIIKGDSTWEFMSKFIRAVYPMLLVLRLADKKDPVMDKLFFYVRRMDNTIEKSRALLDDMGHLCQSPAWRSMNDIGRVDVVDEDSDQSEDDDVDDGNSDDDDSTDIPPAQVANQTTVGGEVMRLWEKRRSKLTTNYAIAGWLLSPIPDIYEDSALNQKGSHREVVDGLLRKVMGGDFADDSNEINEMLNTFWDEFEMFKTKTGPFDKAYIWSNQNQDITQGRSHIWHKKNSYFQTKVLGKFACRVCSKIVGMGSAERNWGDVKYLKSEKRSHLSSEAVEKQATIFGASCMMDASIERKKAQDAQDNISDRYKYWDDEDLDFQFDLLADTSIHASRKRVVKCYFESWEEEHVLRKDDVSKAKFLAKYGGLEFEDIDNDERKLYKVSETEILFQRRTKKDAGGWAVVAYTDMNERDVWPIFKGCALHDCLATYYHQHPEKNHKVLLRKDQVEDIEWLVAQSTNKTQIDAGCDSDDATESSEDNNPRESQSSERDKVGVVTNDAKKSSAGLAKCPECGVLVGSVHKCDSCLRNMHGYCGRPMGEEGYGQLRRCTDCDTKKQITKR